MGCLYVFQIWPSIWVIGDKKIEHNALDFYLFLWVFYFVLIYVFMGVLFGVFIGVFMGVLFCVLKCCNLLSVVERHFGFVLFIVLFNNAVARAVASACTIILWLFFFV